MLVFWDLFFLRCSMVRLSFSHLSHHRLCMYASRFGLLTGIKSLGSTSRLILNISCQSSVLISQRFSIKLTAGWQRAGKLVSLMLGALSQMTTALIKLFVIGTKSRTNLFWWMFKEYVRWSTSQSEVISASVPDISGFVIVFGLSLISRNVECNVVSILFGSIPLYSCEAQSTLFDSIQLLCNILYVIVYSMLHAILYTTINHKIRCSQKIRIVNNKSTFTQ